MRTSFCCIFFAAVTVSLAQDGPQLEILPTGSVIRRDLGVTGFFTCRASQQHELIEDVVWIDPRGDEVPDERQNRVYSTDTSSGKGRELFVTNITENDSGDYTCKARFGNQEITKSFALLVYMSIRWEDAPKQQNPVTGSRATIKCLVKANPPAIVEWLYSNGKFIRKTDRFTPLETGLLHIEDVSPEDDGVYVCRAKVPAEGEMAERRITVEVYSRPKITLPVRGTEVEIVEDDEGSVRCQASGNPTPVRSWLSPDGTDAALVPGLTVGGDGTLTFRPARRQMAGQYRCTAENDVDTVETTIQVVVIVRPEIVRYENMTSTEAESATLECRVFGSPLPTVSFRKAGSDTSFEEGVFSGDDRVMVQQRQEDGEQVGVLTIRELTRTDAGLYECVATNAGGQAAAPGRLTVQYRPQLSGPPAGEVFTWTGQPANLSCRAQAEPEAAVSWQFGGARPEDDPHMQQTQDAGSATLTVTPTEARYFGVYTCTATNTLGSDSLDVTLREATAPGPVSGVTVQEVTATSMQFSVPAPASDGGLPVTSYLAQYVLLGQPWDAPEERQWPAGGPFSLDGLTPEQTYLFRFAAENAVGLGGWSEELQQVMPKIAVPQPPQMITAEGVPVAAEVGSDAMVSSDQAESYEVRWRAGADNGADIDNYQVSFYKVISRKNVWRVVTTTKRTSVVEAPGPLVFRLADLKPDSDYRVELRAHNRIGFSEPARLIIHTAAGVEQESAAPPSRASSLVVGVVIAVLLVVLVLCDLTCYAVNSRGITHMLCSKARGSSGSAKLTEEAASEKEPLQENGNGNKSTPPEVNGERDAAEVTIDKAQLDAARDSAV